MSNIKTILRTTLLSLVAFATTASAVPSTASAGIFDTSVRLMAPTLEGKLNINTATEKEWDLLPGIGPATAKKLVAYRNRQPYKALLNVLRIKGIGRKTYNKIEPYLTLKGATTLHEVGKAKTKPVTGPVK